MSFLTLILLLYAGGLLLVVLDVLVIPTHVAGFVGLALVAISVFMMFRYEAVWLAVVMLVLSVAIGAAMVKLVGDRYVLRHEARREDGYIASDPRLPELQGKTGVAATPLRPSGKAMIGDRRIDVVTRGEMIDARTPIVVIQVEGNRVVVKTDAPAEA